MEAVAVEEDAGADEEEADFHARMGVRCRFAAMVKREEKVVDVEREEGREQQLQRLSLTKKWDEMAVFLQGRRQDALGDPEERVAKTEERHSKARRHVATESPLLCLLFAVIFLVFLFVDFTRCLDGIRFLFRRTGDVQALSSRDRHCFVAFLFLFSSLFFSRR